MATEILERATAALTAGNTAQLGPIADELSCLIESGQRELLHPLRIVVEAMPSVDDRIATYAKYARFANKDGDFKEAMTDAFFVEVAASPFPSRLDAYLNFGLVSTIDTNFRDRCALKLLDEARDVVSPSDVRMLAAKGSAFLTSPGDIVEPHALNAYVVAVAELPDISDRIRAYADTMLASPPAGANGAICDKALVEFVRCVDKLPKPSSRIATYRQYVDRLNLEQTEIRHILCRQIMKICDDLLEPSKQLEALQYVAAVVSSGTPSTSILKQVNDKIAVIHRRQDVAEFVKRFARRATQPVPC